MTMAPLFAKYGTETGKYYVYDPETNELIRVEAPFSILDDFGVLTMDEMRVKHSALREATIQSAWTDWRSSNPRASLQITRRNRRRRWTAYCVTARSNRLRNSWRPIARILFSN